MLVGKCGFGYGSRLDVALSAASRVSSNRALISNDSPVVFELKPTTGPGRGGELITALGSRFGTAFAATPSKMKAVLGGTDCSASLAWTSDTAVTFIHPPGILPGLSVEIIADDLLSYELHNAFGFAKPQLTAVAPALRPTSGKTDITFFGMSFGGNQHDLALLKVGSTTCFQTTWLSDTSARCRVPSGVSHQLTATYSIGNFAIALTRVFSYANPVVKNVRPSYGNTRGGNFISIFGESFGHGTPIARVLCFFIFCTHHILTQSFVAFRFLQPTGQSRSEHLPAASALLRLLLALRCAAWSWRVP
jgi:hypothetical protein